MYWYAPDAPPLFGPDVVALTRLDDPDREQDVGELLR